MYPASHPGVKDGCLLDCFWMKHISGRIPIYLKRGLCLSVLSSPLKHSIVVYFPKGQSAALIQTMTGCPPANALPGA